MTTELSSKIEPSAKKTIVGGGVGGAIGVLAVLFMPDTWHIFTPEEASMATAAIGIVFSYAMRYLPAPNR